MRYWTVFDRRTLDDRNHPGANRRYNPNTNMDRIFNIGGTSSYDNVNFGIACLVGATNEDLLALGNAIVLQGFVEGTTLVLSPEALRDRPGMAQLRTTKNIDNCVEYHMFTLIKHGAIVKSPCAECKNVMLRAADKCRPPMHNCAVDFFGEDDKLSLPSESLYAPANLCTNVKMFKSIAYGSINVGYNLGEGIPGEVLEERSIKAFDGWTTKYYKSIVCPKCMASEAGNVINCAVNFPYCCGHPIGPRITDTKRIRELCNGKFANRKATRQGLQLLGTRITTEYLVEILGKVEGLKRIRLDPELRITCVSRRAGAVIVTSTNSRCVTFGRQWELPYSKVKKFLEMRPKVSNAAYTDFEMLFLLFRDTGIINTVRRNGMCGTYIYDITYITAMVSGGVISCISTHYAVIGSRVFCISFDDFSDLLDTYARESGDCSSVYRIVNDQGSLPNLRDVLNTRTENKGAVTAVREYMTKFEDAKQSTEKFDYDKELEQAVYQNKVPTLF